MSPTVLVTGALGNVGTPVVRALLERGLSVRAADIALQPMRDRFGAAVEAVHLDLTDPSTFEPALEGVDRLFLIRPPAISRVGPTLNAFVDVAARQGVEHVVFSSVAGAESSRIVPHHRVETHLQASGLGWTMLRPGFFAQNIGSAYRRDIIEDDRVYVPAGSGLVAFIDTRDLGEAAAIVLSEDGHTGKAYHLTGPEAISFDQLGGILSEVLGRTIRYQPAGILGYVRHLRRQGLVMPQAVVQTILHAGLRRGDAEAVTDELPGLLGRPARSVREYVTDHAELWSLPAEGRRSNGSG
jgi:uncharacterized protein YbjT (DUF2867 family)